ncbi:MAG TPA: hypothetical protein VHE35_01895 [Kofleriaceae bacterium]|nr:hypothetical protein [Kofleriaceae bacterium]
MKHLRLLSLSILAAASLAAGCGGTPHPTPPPPPFRPVPKPPAPPPAATRTDCDPPNPALQPDAKTYAERAPRIDEAKRLAEEGLAKLQAAEGTSLDPASREQLITDAVQSFIDSLTADPYNVNATYNLAAAYARINRKQCAYNLLERLILMKDHASRSVEVNQKLDRLLGRNKTPLDPDFRDMRSEETFACIINNIGAATRTNCFAAKS